MAKNKKRSTACKMLCAMALTALVLENSFLQSVPVYADDDVDQMIRDAYLDWAGNSLSLIESIDYSNPAATLVGLAFVGSIMVGEAMAYNAMDEGYSLNDLDGLDIELGNVYGDCVVGQYRQDGTLHNGTIPLYRVNSNNTYIFEGANWGGGMLSMVRVIGDTFVLFDKFQSPSDRAFSMFILNSSTSSPAHSYTYSTVKMQHYCTATGTLFVADQTYSNSGSMATVYYSTSSTIPAFSSLSLEIYPAIKITDTYSGTSFRTLISNATVVTLPSGTMTLAAPWDYINDVALPYVRSHDPDFIVPDNFVVPTGNDGSINGLVLPPGIPNPQFNSPDIPSDPLPQKMLEGAGFWFTQFSDLLDGLGVTWIVIIFMVVALLMAILRL